MTGQDILFEGKRLSDFGLIMANPDNGNGNSRLAREILKGTTTAYRSEAVHYGAKYSDTLQLDFLVIKNPCINDNMEIFPFELRKIQSWLTCSKLPKSLYLMTSEGLFIEYCGVFTDISPYEVNGINGLNLAFTCDSPFAYKTNETKINPAGSSSVIRKNIYCDTDETTEMTYPTITFYPNGIGKISITNNTDAPSNNCMSFTLEQIYQKIVIDCKLKRIIADGNILSLSDVGWNISNITDFNDVNTGIFKMYWLRLLPGKNEVDFSGNGEFSIKFKTRLKLGGLIYV